MCIRDSHSVDSFVQTYKVNHPEEVVPSTKTIYRYIKEGLLAIKPIDLPKMVSIRKCSKKVMKTNKKTLGKSIEERPEYINAVSYTHLIFAVTGRRDNRYTTGPVSFQILWELTGSNR